VRGAPAWVEVISIRMGFSVFQGSAPSAPFRGRSGPLGVTTRH
jgi:hypothetical protein